MRKLDRADRLPSHDASRLKLRCQQMFIFFEDNAELTRADACALAMTGFKCSGATAHRRYVAWETWRIQGADLTVVPSSGRGRSARLTEGEISSLMWTIGSSPALKCWTLKEISDVAKSSFGVNLSIATVSRYIGQANLQSRLSRYRSKESKASASAQLDSRYSDSPPGKVDVFIMECCVNSTDTATAKELMAEAYVTWCRVNSTGSVSADQFAKEMSIRFPSYRPRIRKDGLRPQHYHGVVIASAFLESISSNLPDKVVRYTLKQRRILMSIKKTMNSIYRFSSNSSHDEIDEALIRDITESNFTDHLKSIYDEYSDAKNTMRFGFGFSYHGSDIDLEQEIDEHKKRFAKSAYRILTIKTLITK